MFLSLPALIGVLFVIPGPTRYLGAWILMVAFFLVVSPVYLIPHEAAHAVMGKLLGYRIFSVTIGIGPIIWTRRIRSANFELRVLPIYGFVLAAPTSSGHWRLRKTLFSAAGPLVNAVISIVLIWAAIHFAFTPERLGARALPLYIILLPNLAGMVFNLWPATIRIHGERKPSDGLSILKALFSPKPPREGAASRALLEAAHAMASGDHIVAKRWAFEAFGYEEYRSPARVLLAAIHLLQNEPEAAWDLLRPFIAKTDEPGELRSEAVFLFSYAALLIAKNEVFSEVLALIGASPNYTEPSDPKVNAMRGCVLIALGQIELGLSIGRDAFANPGLNKVVLPDLACLLAEGEKKRGNGREADLYGRIAREMGANSRLLARLVGQCGTGT